jgi:hypothetical protein
MNACIKRHLIFYSIYEKYSIRLCQTVPGVFFSITSSRIRITISEIESTLHTALCLGIICTNFQQFAAALNEPV